MKLVLLYFPAGCVGGVETVLAEHASLFAEHRHEAEVVSGSEFAAEGRGEIFARAPARASACAGAAVVDRVF